MCLGKTYGGGRQLTVPVPNAQANTHSYDKKTTSLRDYLATSMAPRSMADVASSTFYHFGDNNYSSWVNFTDHYWRPPYNYGREPFFSFGIGGSGSGVPFHTHGAVFAEVLHGAKRWFITAPGHKPVFDPNETSFRWLHYHYPAAGAGAAGRPPMFDCVLYPGEVLFIDTQYWHSTLNIGDTVFISTFL